MIRAACMLDGNDVTASSINPCAGFVNREQGRYISHVIFVEKSCSRWWTTIYFPEASPVPLITNRETPAPQS